jgi:hypothetical protein
MLNKLIFAALLCLLFAPQQALCGDDKPASIELTQLQLKAMTTALNRFQTDGNKVDDYSVLVTTWASGIEVVFVPELVKSSNMVGFERSTKSEIHYYLDTTGLRIIKVLLGQ